MERAETGAHGEAKTTRGTLESASAENGGALGEGGGVWL